MGKGDHISAGGSENRDTLSRVAGRLSDSYWGGDGVPGCAANPRELGDQLPVSVAHGEDGDPGESRRVAGRWRGQVNGNVPDEEQPGQLASLSSD